MKLLMGMLGGALIGAGTALLLAPQSGRKTRAMIRDKAVHYEHEAQDFVESKATHLRNKMEGWKHRATKMAEEAGDLQSMTQEVSQRSQEMIGRGQDMIDRGMDAIRKSASAATGTIEEDSTQPVMA